MTAMTAKLTLPTTIAIYGTLITTLGGVLSGVTYAVRRDESVKQHERMIQEMAEAVKENQKMLMAHMGSDGHPILMQRAKELERRTDRLEHQP